MISIRRGCVTLGWQALDLLLPLHLLIDLHGQIRNAGPMMRKLLPVGPSRLQDSFTLLRRGIQTVDPQDFIHACLHDERLFLRLNAMPQMTLRGHAIPFPNGCLLNLGFGIGLVDAVRELNLTDSDFAPPDLAMELLFLHEANRAAMTELSRFNRYLAAARQEAEMQAFSDPLTGLPNRRGLDMSIRDLLRRLPEGGTFAIAHLDLDHFKEVNDKYGHAAGDAVLTHVACALRETIRWHDTAARVGGDEFVLLLDGIDSRADLESLAQRIIDGIRQPIGTGAGSCHVSASIGIICAQAHEGVVIEDLLRQADAALYQSKREGRARATIRCAGKG